MGGWVPMASSAVGSAPMTGGAMLMAQLAEGAQWSTQRVRRCPGGSQTSNIMLLYHMKSVQCVGSHDSASGGALSAVKTLVIH